MYLIQMHFEANPAPSLLSFVAEHHSRPTVMYVLNTLLGNDTI